MLCSLTSKGWLDVKLDQLHSFRRSAVEQTAASDQGSSKLPVHRGRTGQLTKEYDIISCLVVSWTLPKGWLYICLLTV